MKNSPNSMRKSCTCEAVPGKKCVNREWIMIRRGGWTDDRVGTSSVASKDHIEFHHIDRTLASSDKSHADGDDKRLAHIRRHGGTDRWVAHTPLNENLCMRSNSASYAPCTTCLHSLRQTFHRRRGGWRWSMPRSS